MKHVKYVEIMLFDFAGKKCFEQNLRSLKNDEKLKEKKKEKEGWTNNIKEIFYEKNSLVISQKKYGATD